MIENKIKILKKKFIEKNSFFEETKDEIDDFEFNQDFDTDSDYRSPGWIRYQKRIK